MKIFARYSSSCKNLDFCSFFLQFLFLPIIPLNNEVVKSLIFTHESSRKEIVKALIFVHYSSKL